MVMLTDIYVLPPDSKERTFQYDKDLPSLPLPSLSNTLAKYLDSVEPLVTEEEFKKTKKIVKEFENGIGQELNEKLKQRAATERNWLERWWEDYAYLCNREPLLPGCNMTGPSPTTELGWKYAPGKQALFAARYCYHLVSIWIFLRQERYRPMKVKSQKTGELKIFNMNQYRRLFNTCQVPRNFMDEMVKHFRTETEGDCPSHVIVIHKGRFYKMEAFLDSGEQLTTAEWQKSLSLIVEDALEKEVQGDNVACLSSDNRDIWAENREYMTSLDSRNAEILHEIESSMFVLCLDDDCPETQSAVSHLSLAGDLTCRWADKALQIVFFNNGSSAGVCNHAAYDGIVSVTTMHFLHLSLTENRDNWEESISVRPNLKVPTELEFVVDSELKQRISDALLRQEEKKRQFVMTRMVFNNFGKDHIQQTHKLHPDAFVQLALQLAYFKLHERPAPAYETANTRTFYNGRTETHRSCTKEAVAWCKAMLDKTKTAIEKSKLLKLAVEKHVKLLKEAEQNAGCDRHLFGLQCIAFENNIETPEIFLDPNYIKSGGNGNFVLSTSLVGYTPLGGGVMPMCLHGYGCFYNISSPKISMTLSVRHDSDETSAFKFFDKFSEALLEMDELPCVQNSSTSKL